MTCGKCGCTETTPCVTEAGACHWVAPGLCSACLEEEHGPEEARVLEALLALREDVVGIRVSGVEAFHLLAALQLALRHPALARRRTGMGGEFRARAAGADFARGLQERISRAPAVAELCEKGWQEEFDLRPAMDAISGKADLEKWVASLCRSRELDGVALVLFAPNKRAEVIAAENRELDNFKERLAEVLENLRDGSGMPLGRHGQVLPAREDA